VTETRVRAGGWALKSPYGQPGPGAAFPCNPVRFPLPTKFSGRFPANSNPLESWQEASGIWDRIGQAAAGQTTSATKVRRVDIGGCGPALPFRPSQPRRRGDWACSVPS